METLKKLFGLKTPPTLKELQESYNPKVELIEQKQSLLPYMGAVEKVQLSGTAHMESPSTIFYN